jgi:hypothetical protein
LFSNSFISASAKNTDPLQPWTVNQPLLWAGEELVGVNRIADYDFDHMTVIYLSRESERPANLPTAATVISVPYPPLPVRARELFAASIKSHFDKLGELDTESRKMLIGIVCASLNTAMWPAVIDFCVGVCC